MCIENVKLGEVCCYVFIYFGIMSHISDVNWCEFKSLHISNPPRRGEPIPQKCDSDPTPGDSCKKVDLTRLLAIPLKESAQPYR